MAGLILGIVSVAVSVISNFLPLTIALYGFIFHIVGIVAGIVAMVLSVKAGKVNKTGATTAGLVLGIIGLVLSAILFLSCGLCQICVVLGAGAVGAL